MSDIKVIITDLDGTILPRKGEISEKTIEAFHHLGNRDIGRIIATGRTLHTVKEVINKDFPLDYLIFSSGTGILNWKTGEFLHTFHIPCIEARHIADYLWDNNINFIIQQAIPDNHYFYYTDNYPVHSDYKRRVEKMAEFGTCISSSDEIKSDCTQFIIILNPIHLQLIEKLKKDLSSYSIVRSTSPMDNKSIWIEIY
ncbi:MAG: Cof-type HAD-IIB family hydrolase, partial [Odoribacter sp.]|nr:Cof-type HAD-IIB family hydrolase [Odoribacter sp.]